MKACGVVVAMLQGHRWAPTPSIGSAVNVGTTPMVPTRAAAGGVVGRPVVGRCHRVGRAGVRDRPASLLRTRWACDAACRAQNSQAMTFVRRARSVHARPGRGDGRRARGRLRRRHRAAAGQAGMADVVPGRTTGAVLERRGWVFGGNDAPARRRLGPLRAQVRTGAEPTLADTTAGRARPGLGER